MRLLLVAALCLLAAACSATAAAPPQQDLVSDDLGIDLTLEPQVDSIVRVVESIQTQYYTVEGESASEIRSNLNELGPYSPADGRSYDAITLWGVQPSFRYDRGGGACSVQSATLEMVAVTVLPELGDPSLLNAQTLGRWTSYIEALEGHEQGHVTSVQRGVRALQAAIDAAPAMATCEELRLYLGALGDAYVRAMTAADVAYDADTGHGRTQGAVFP